MKEKYIQFKYDERGFGKLICMEGLSFDCRSGSINTDGELVNVIRPGVWTIREPSVDTTEPGMVVEEGEGWKIRMWTPEGEWSHYLIHPDGGKGGSLGCIVTIGTTASKLRKALDDTLQRQEMIKVYVNTTVPVEAPVVIDKKLPVRPDKMRGTDVFFTTSAKPSGAIIRMTVNGIHKMFDMDIPTHTGFATEDHGQYFASEATPRGFVESSFDKYKKRWDRMHSVWRWDGFDDEEVRYAAQAHLARLRRNRRKYDWRGLLPFVPAVRRWFPWVRQNPKRDFCSENVFTVCKRYGLKDYPKQWDKRPPSPHALITHFCERDDFHRIDCV